jgi:hypothetical protein
MTADRPLYFDEETLLAQLNQLSPRLRAAFAVSCAERLYPMCERMSETAGIGDGVLMRRVLDRVWLGIREGDLEEREIRSLIELVEKLGPTENYEVTGADSRADIDSPSVALAYALESLLPSRARSALCAAREAFEVLWVYEDRDESFWSTPPTAEQLAAHTAKALLQAELRRQEQDLADLASVEHAGQLPSKVDLLRRRAGEDAITFFG